MSELLNALTNPGTMGQAQWLVLAIAAFIVLGSMYFVWKLYKILFSTRKSTYKPNIGLSTLAKRSSSSRQNVDGEDSP
jgi:hypothetical protein